MSRIQEGVRGGGGAQDTLKGPGVSQPGPTSSSTDIKPGHNDLIHRTAEIMEKNLDYKVGHTGPDNNVGHTGSKVGQTGPDTKLEHTGLDNNIGHVIPDKAMQSSQAAERDNAGGIENDIELELGSSDSESDEDETSLILDEDEAENSINFDQDEVVTSLMLDQDGQVDFLNCNKNCKKNSMKKNDQTFVMSSAQQGMTEEEVDAVLMKAGLLHTHRPHRATSEGWDVVSVSSCSECRVGSCRLTCLQPLATIAVFTAMCCALATLNGALTAGYVNSVITTIEKRFEIGSSYSGLIAASVEMGGVMSVVVVSYFGSTRHIPNWIGFGALITCAGTLVFTVPHMMAPAYTMTGGLNTSRYDENTCRRPVHKVVLSRSSPGDRIPAAVGPAAAAAAAAARMYQGGGVMGGRSAVGAGEDWGDCLSKESGQIGYVLILVLAQMLIGIGGSPIYTLGTTYIDNHVSKLKAPSYIAFIYASGVFGPVLGFALGALMLQYYVDLFTFDSVTLNLTSSHPRWVGAWWGGFIFIGGLLFLISLPFYGFPRMLLPAIRKVLMEESDRLDALIHSYRRDKSPHAPDLVFTLTTQPPSTQPHQNCLKSKICRGKHRQKPKVTANQKAEELGGQLDRNHEPQDRKNKNLNNTMHVRQASDGWIGKAVCNKMHFRHASDGWKVGNKEGLLGQDKGKKSVTQDEVKILCVRSAENCSQIPKDLLADQATESTTASAQSGVLGGTAVTGQPQSSSGRRSGSKQGGLGSVRKGRGSSRSRGGSVGGESLKKNIQDFPGAAWSILTNPIYIVTCLGICCEVSIVSGFVVFLPKYLETQFGSTKSMANLLTGGIAIPGAVVGILFGGYCLRHFQLSRKGAIQLTLVMNLIALASFGVFFCLGCDNLRIAGVTEPYVNGTQYRLYKQRVAAGAVRVGDEGWGGVFSINLTSQCNADCSCNDNMMEPVCSDVGITYFSPCHAGCSSVNSRFLPSHLQNFSDCSCLEKNDSSDDIMYTRQRSLRSGLCNEVCDTLVPFMATLFIMTFFICGTQMPLLMITMRSVKEEEKAFALGIQFVMLRVFAYIPSPIMYGKCIDSTCALWTEQCGAPGNCLLYDLELFRYKYVGMSFVLKSLAAVFYLSIWFLLCRRRYADEEGHDKVTHQQQQLQSIFAFKQQAPEKRPADEKQKHSEN